MPRVIEFEDFEDSEGVDRLRFRIEDDFCDHGMSEVGGLAAKKAM